MWEITGKTVLITGSTAGIGLEAAVALARLGARVLVVGRDPHRTEAAVVAIKTRAGITVESYLCDFSSQTQIRGLADRIRRDHPRVDVLLNNVGGVNKRRTLTVDGIESTFALNHLAPFLLTNLLIDLILQSAPARVVTVSSVGHRSGTIDFDDLGFERGYGILKAYSRSKLANVLFANELARRLATSGVTSNSVHPGSVATDIWSDVPWWAKPIVAMFLRPTFITPEEGGVPLVNLVANPALDGVTGQYFDRLQAEPPLPAAQDPALSRRLWDVSAELVHLDSY
jgi:NAD(P)-dependent dehydrogenase (short-subunit alcohol dehydrogenase family)